IWYILSNIPNDYQLVSEHRMGLATACVFISSVCELIDVNSNVPSRPLPALADIGWRSLRHCSSLRFFLRARAIFNRNTYLVLFFVLWLSVAASAAAIPTAVGAIKIGRTKFCLNASARSYTGAPGITQIIHDTTIFLVISWRLVQALHTDHGFRQNFRAFMTGQYLPDFSRAVLKDGQFYYLSLRSDPP
ncbi:hypothetical protein B0H13DRAFT_1629275, partial [Mycena leptocephala]